MLIYNVTTNVEENIHQEWVAWMKEEYIPEMLATGKFSKALMSRVLVNEQMGGITYSIPYKRQGYTQPILCRRCQQNGAKIKAV